MPRMRARSSIEANDDLPKSPSFTAYMPMRHIEPVSKCREYAVY
jgi:hypothetical protein